MASKFDLEKFVQEQLKLIQLERTAEIEECTASRRVKNVKELEKRGVCISKLFPGAQCTGLYGKHLVTLLQKQRNFAKNSNKKENENLRTPEERVTANCFSNGDIVGLQLSNSDPSEENIASGVVTKVNDNSVTVAFEDSIDVSQCDMYRLIKLTNDVTYRRLKEALHQLKSDKNQAQHLKNILFHVTNIGPPLSAVNKETFVPFDKTLNDSQLEAVQFALNQRELGVIHGPPGTGKTTTVIEIIKQAVKKFDLKVLACAPSNVAVDNLVAKLTGEKIKLVRLGHPARVYSHLQKYSLDAALMNSDSAEVVQGVRNDISETLGKLRKARNDGEARKLKSELKYLKRELRERENKALKFVLSNANVILSTTTSSSMEGPLKHLENEHFDLLIIDEAAQALEASCWIALPYANKCILAGDHQQLPPTIISKEAAKKGLEVTLMERVIKEFGEPVVKMLTTQYRMHNDIMTWPSNELYNGKLVADESVSSHLLSGLPGVEATENTEIPLLFVDTAGRFMYELQEETEESKGNHYEVSIVEELVESLVSSGVKQEYIGVITPYNLQVELIRQALSSKYPKIEVRSVDGFQGREKEAIVMSLVRSNEQGEVGFLKEDRRLNVAITRARRHLAVVGDSQTISHHSFLKSFFEYAIEHGEVRSAHASCAQKTTTMLSHSSIETQAGGNDSLDDFDDLKFSLFSGANRKEIRKRTDIGKGNGKDFDRRNSKESSHGMVRNRVSLKENELASNVARSQTENDWPKVKEDIDNKIREFCSLSTQREFAFDSSLDAKARFYVHEVAERFGLVHKSTGEGKDRRICVKKASWKQTQENEADQIVEGERGNDDHNDNDDGNDNDDHNDNDVGNHNEDGYDDDATATRNVSEMAMCENCKTEMPESNLQLHAFRCKKKVEEDDNRGMPSKASQVKKKKNKKKTTNINKVDKESGEDFDKLLEEFTKVNSVCAQNKCKASVLTLGQHCKHCKKMYCLKHSQAEVHGCTEAARTEARVKARQQYDRSFNKPSDEIKKRHIKRKLDKKLTEMETARTRAKEKQKEHK